MANITPNALLLAEKIWAYHHVGHSLQKADCIFALGSHDLRVGEYAVDLYLQGWAPWLILSGGLGNFTKGFWTEAEADKFAKIAREKGVPEEAIIVENKSTNTGENIIFTKALLMEKGIDPINFILIQKPYMERRTLATFAKQWPGKNFVVSSPPIAFRDYPNEEIPMERVISIMIGDLQRIKYYPAMGYQTFQHIPDDVWDASEQLIAMGFNSHLLKERP